jgi:hypothetical protein
MAEAHCSTIKFSELTADNIPTSRGKKEYFDKYNFMTKFLAVYPKN